MDKNSLPVIGENEELKDEVQSKPSTQVVLENTGIAEIGEEDENSDDEDEFLKMIDQEDANDPFSNNLCLEPDMTRRLSEKPAMKKEDSYEYKMNDLEFEFPADENVIKSQEEYVKELEEQKSNVQVDAEKEQLAIMKEMLKKQRAQKPGFSQNVKQVNGFTYVMPNNFDPTMPCEIDQKIMKASAAVKQAAFDPNSKEAMDESMRQLAAHQAKLQKVQDAKEQAKLMKEAQEKSKSKDISQIDSIFREGDVINVPIKNTSGQQFDNKIVKNFEYEQNKKLFAESLARIHMIPPVWTGLPKNVSGTVLKVNGDDTYDVVTDSDIHLTKIPINFMRSDKILCSGKNVQSCNAKEMLTGKKYAIPTYQRKYSWKTRDWTGIIMDHQKQSHSMGAINCYLQETGDDPRLHVCDGQQRLTTLSLLLGAIRNCAIKSNQMQIVSQINELLFHDVPAFEEWSKNNSVKDIKDGDYLSFFRLIPTYCDRKQYYLALLDTNNEVEHVKNSLIEKGYSFFKNCIIKAFSQQIGTFLSAVLTNFRYVYFEVYNSGQHKQLYQGLVTRSEGLRHGFKAEKPGQYLLEVDKLRNHFQDYFETEEAIEDFNMKHWIPIDLLCANNDELELVFLNFCQEQIAPKKIEIKDGRVVYFGPFVEWMARFQTELTEKEKIQNVLAMVLKFINKDETAAKKKFKATTM